MIHSWLKKKKKKGQVRVDSDSAHTESDSELFFGDSTQLDLVGSQIYLFIPWVHFRMYDSVFRFWPWGQMSLVALRHKNSQIFVSFQLSDLKYLFYLVAVVVDAMGLCIPSILIFPFLNFIVLILLVTFRS